MLKQSKQQRFIPDVEFLERREMLDAASLGSQGIEAINDYNLTGRNVAVGQIEEGRPGRPNVQGENANSNVRPAGVIDRQGARFVNNTPVDGHAENVASIMVSQGNQTRGVVPDASLYSYAYGILNAESFGYNAVAMQSLMLQNANSGGVHVVNLSFGSIPGYITENDGSSLTSLAVDYFSQTYDSLFVIAAGNYNDEFTAPADSFNGIVVGASRIAGEIVRNFDTQVSPRAQTADGREVLNILAPGYDVTVDALGESRTEVVRGSSFATPHVSGIAAALLSDPTQAQNRDARRHQVLKSVILNSAEVLAGELDSNKTAKSATTVTWTQSPARDNNNPNGSRLPFDPNFGVGLANQKRAVRQLRGGQFGPGNNVVDPIGWDYNSIGNNARTYSLGRLAADSYIAITLSWDRKVEKIENPDLQGNDPNQFNWTPDGGDRLVPETRMADLDIELIDANGNVVARSDSTRYSVEHLFFQLPNQAQEYSLRITRLDNGTDNREYGLAWWSERAQAPVFSIGCWEAELYDRSDYQFVSGTTSSDSIDLGSVSNHSVWIEGGWGADVLSGGSLNDIIFSDKAIVGNAAISFDADSDELLGVRQQSSGVGSGQFEWLIGNAGDDLLFGAAASDVIYGDDFSDLVAGDDVLFGFAGDDQLFGGGGNDLLVAGVGSDILDGGDGQDETSWCDLTFNGTGSHVAGVVLNLSSFLVQYQSGLRRNDSSIWWNGLRIADADTVAEIGAIGYGGNIVRDVEAGTARHKSTNNWLDNVDQVYRLERFTGSRQLNDVAVLDAGFVVTGIDEDGYTLWSDGVLTYGFKGFETFIALPSSNL